MFFEKKSLPYLYFFNSFGLGFKITFSNRFGIPSNLQGAVVSCFLSLISLFNFIFPVYFGLIIFNFSIPD